MPRTLHPVDKVQLTVRVSQIAADALSEIARVEITDRAAVAARILEIAKHIQPSDFLQVLAAFEKAARRT